MEPVLRGGDFVYIDPDVPMASGDLVGVLRDGATVVRRYREAGGRRLLATLNPEVVDCVLDAGNETSIQGVVVFKGWEVGAAGKWLPRDPA